MMCSVDGVDETRWPRLINADVKRWAYGGPYIFFCIFKIEIYTIMSFCLKGLKLGITAQPSFLIPALRKVEGGESGVQNA